MLDNYYLVAESERVAALAQNTKTSTENGTRGHGVGDALLLGTAYEGISSVWCGYSGSVCAKERWVCVSP